MKLTTLTREWQWCWQERPGLPRTSFTLSFYGGAAGGGILQGFRNTTISRILRIQIFKVIKCVISPSASLCLCLLCSTKSLPGRLNLYLTSPQEGLNEYWICFEPSNCNVRQHLFSDVKNLSFSVISYNKVARDFHCREIVKYFNVWSLQPSPLACTCYVQQNLFLKHSFSLSVIFTSTRIEWILNLLWAFKLLCEKKQQFYF